MSIETKFLKVTMPDDSKWKIPIRVIAEHRARYFGNKYKYTFERALENTLELFEEDEYEVEDWCENSMDWSDVSKYAEKIKDKGLTIEDLEEGWLNGEKEIVEE